MEQSCVYGSSITKLCFAELLIWHLVTQIPFTSKGRLAVSTVRKSFKYTSRNS